MSNGITHPPPLESRSTSRPTLSPAFLNTKYTNCEQ